MSVLNEIEAFASDAVAVAPGASAIGVVAVGRVVARDFRIDRLVVGSIERDPRSRARR